MIQEGLGQFGDIMDILTQKVGLSNWQGCPCMAGKAPGRKIAGVLHYLLLRPLSFSISH